MIGFIFFLLIVGILVGLYLKIFADSVPDNTLGAAFWLNGFYGGVFKPGFVWFKLPGAKIITHSTEPRVSKKVEQTVRLEAASGPIAVVKISMILGLDPKTNDLKHFETFHREEKALESSAIERMTRWLDDRIGREDDPNANGVKKAIETEAKAELQDFLTRKFGSVKVALAEFKIDLDEDVREAMEEKKKQQLKNEADKLKQEQFNLMIDAMLAGSGGQGLSRKEAATVILALMDKKATVSDQTFNIKGLEGLGEATSIIIAALNKKERKSEK